MDRILVVIDGNSLINRGYYAIQKPMITKEGIYTQGIYAFLSMLSKIRSDYKPTHMLVAFDRKAPTFRHLEYNEYKAGRKGMPIELAMEMPILKDILDAMGIPRFEIDGFEADDIMGTAARMSEEEGVKCFVITGDRDALQLATNLTSVIINKRGMTEFKLYDDNAMMEEYGFDHDQFIDYKALRGDSSDNIPGIPGVGEKTATNLIQQFGSLENLIRNTEQITNAKLRQKIEDGAMSAMMSKRLATIVKTVPLDMSFDDLAVKQQDSKTLSDLYTKLEFKKFLAELMAEDNLHEEDTAEASDITYPETVVVNDFSEGIRLIRSFEDIFVLFESDDNHISLPKASSLCVYSEGKSYFFEIDDIDAFCEEAFNGLNCCISGFDLGKLFYYLNAKGINTSGLIIRNDCRIAEYLLNPGTKEESLSDLIYEYFRIKTEESSQQFSLLPQDNDKDIIFKKLFLSKLLSDILEKEADNAGLGFVYRSIELPLIKVLASMEAVGITADKAVLTEFGTMLKAHIKQLEEEIYELSGEKFNINSPQQLGNILFDKLGLPAGKKTSRGYSTNAEILEKLAPDHEIVSKILEYRSYAKLNSTYVEGLLPLIAADGKVHAHFQQTVTSTGRISCTEPNLQNIPIRTELGRQLRKVFVAPEGRVFVGADYSQIELRIMAALSGDPALIEAFEKGHDIHKETAAKVFNVSPDEVTSEQRSNAKAVNFGVIYGMSQFGLSNELTITRKEAEKYINDYFRQFSSVKRFLDDCIKQCRETGEIRTYFGRRRIVREINASRFMDRQLGERLAMNTPIQGTAADIIKLAMNSVYERLSNEFKDAKLILQIHDELIIECNEKDAESVCRLLEECMQNAAELSVKLSVSKSIADNWYDLK